MRAHTQVGNAELFALYAGRDVDRWNELAEQRVEHRFHGQGTIKEVTAGESDLIVKISFDGDAGNITYVHLQRFCDPFWFPCVTLPTGHPALEQFLVPLQETNETTAQVEAPPHLYPASTKRAGGKTVRERPAQELARREVLLKSIADTIADYRYGEIPAPTPDHVDRWVRQFDHSDQQTILEEMGRILRTTYVSRRRAERFVRGLVTSRKVFGPSPATALRDTRFLRIQRKGNSQNDLLELGDTILQAEYGFGIDACGVAPPSLYIYLDDCVFSGNTAWHDLEVWLPSATADSTLHLVFFGVYKRGIDYVRRSIRAATRSLRLSIRSWLEFQNYPGNERRYDCIWPRDLGGDPYVDTYVAWLRERNRDQPHRLRLFRPAETPVEEAIFSSPAARDVVEQAFLRAGAYIVSLPTNPKAEMRPLGYEYFDSLGFGATLVTYRNIANNCPLALWWGDPSQHRSHPFSKWYPLFPRSVNAPGSSGYDWYLENS
jgi:hypothetical protein